VGKEQSGGGIGIPAAVFLIFLTLKLLGVAPVAAWSWWWVTAPLWGAFVLAGLVVLAAWSALTIAGWLDARRRVRRLLDDG